MIIYPSTLPDFKIGKSRTQQQQFDTTQPFDGPLYTEKVRDESPVTWSITVDCTSRVQAQMFQAFVKAVKNGQSFEKEILTEFGMVTHEVMFIDEPLAPQQTGTFTWSYSGTIYARELINPNDEIDDSLIYLYLDQASIIDVAANEAWG